MERAIVFIHGLNGGEESWKGKKINYYERFRAENEIVKNYDLHVFKYHTKIFEIKWFKKILTLISSKKRKAKFNGSIRDIGLSLKNYINVILQDYKLVILITHSMGGLVAKKAMVEMTNEELSRIPLYFSLSVPHNGARLANIGKDLIGKKNSQLINLGVFSAFTTELSRDFSGLENTPKAIYQRGYNDIIVPEGSAIPESARPENIIDTDDNHFSVREVDDPKTNITYNRILIELRALLRLGTYGKIHDPVKITIPDNPNWTFKEVTITLAKSVDASLVFEGFTEQELKTLIRGQSLSFENSYDALMAIRDIALTPIPNYDVKINYSKIRLIKK